MNVYPALVFCNHNLLPLLTAVLFHIPVFFALIFIRLHFPFPFLPEHPLFEDATVFRCVLSGSQLWRAPSPYPTRLPALPNHHSPHGSQRRGTRLPLPRHYWGQLRRQRQLLRRGRGCRQLVSLQPDAGRPAHQMWQLQVRDGLSQEPGAGDLPEIKPAWDMRGTEKHFKTRSVLLRWLLSFEKICLFLLRIPSWRNANQK